uniref:C2H2-type domain-containing protein n=1 Tax=Anopheles culicifacies TaxID=139723 RepID=A0A182M2Y1_9DIPT
MSTPSKQAQQSGPATTGGTGGSNFFRRKKIVPSVVVRKLSNNNTKNLAKSASSNESTKNVPAQEKTGAVASIATTETFDLEQQVVQTKATETVIPMEKDILKTVESRDVKKSESQNSNAAAPFEPAPAFRRIKPKVIIPQTQKPAKSILKNSTTPVKSKYSSTEKPDSATGSNEAIASNESKSTVVNPGGDISTAKDVPTHNQLSEESVKSKQSPHDVKPTLSQTDMIVESITTQQILQDVTKAEELSKSIDVPNSTALKNEPLNSSLPVASSQETSIPLVKLESSTPTSVIPITEDISKQHIPDTLAKTEITPGNPIAAIATKTIKRTISLNKLSPEIANLLKSSLGKKATKGTKPLPGKATPDLSNRTASQANQENQSTQPTVAEVDKPSSERIVPGSPTGVRLPVLETRLENVSLKETIGSTKPPSPVKPSPTPAKQPESSGPGPGVKKIQKVHQLTEEQRRLVLNSLKKGKVKGAVRKPETASVTKNNNVAVSQVLAENTLPNPSASEPMVLPIEMGPPVSTVCSVPKDEYRVNIISHIILPRLPSVGVVAQPTELKEPDGSVPVPTTSQNVSTNEATPLSQPIEELSPATLSPANVFSNNANQYPKLFICHKPAPSSSPYAIPSSPVRMNAPLVPPVVSISVLPKMMQPTAQYPTFMNAVPTILPTNYLPEPVITVQPTSEKHSPYRSIPPPPLPIPSVTVTLSPRQTNPSLPIPIDVPVDPRIVPKIVIDGCDAVDHDSQSSLTSSSSSSSSGNINTTVLKQLTDARSDSVKPTVTARADTGTGCSPDTLDKLRAKSLKNLIMKNEVRMSGVLDSQLNLTPVRQYGRTASREQSNLQSKTEPHQTITKQRIKECISKKIEPISSKAIEITSNLVTKCTTDIQPSALTVNDDPSEPAKSVEQTKLSETNEFLGFSISSIESAERDFENRARSIDLALEVTRKSLKVAKSNEESPEELVSNSTADKSKYESTPSVGMKEEIGEEAVVTTNTTICATLSTSANDHNRTTVIDPRTSSMCTDTAISSEHDEREVNTQKIEPEAGAPLQDAPSKTASEEMTVTILDSNDGEIKNTHENHINTVTEENATSIDKPTLEESVIDSNRSDGEDVSEAPDGTGSGDVSEDEPIDDTMAEGEDPAVSAPDPVEKQYAAKSIEEPIPEQSVSDSNQCEAKDVPEAPDDTGNGNVSEAEPNDNTMADAEDPAIPGPDLIDQGATGVDVIVAMAKLRRENRVMSLGDTSDCENVGWTEEPLVTPTKPTSLASGGHLRAGTKKKRKRHRRKRRDAFVELLLKHVNYDALIEDVVKQEKQRCNYVSSSEEEVHNISPLQRYIRERDREQERSVAIVESDMDCSSSAKLSEDEESLVEETILKRVLNRLKLNEGGSSAVADASPSSTNLQVEKSAECSNTSQPVICSESVISDDQKDDVQRSIICDRAAEMAEMEIKSAQTVRESMSDVEMAIVDPMPSRIDENVKQERNKSCDTIETNAATCDTRAGAEKTAVASPPKGAETINTHAKQVQVACHTRRTIRKRVTSRKRPARLGNRLSSCTIKQKRLKYSITPPVVEMPMYDSSDAPNNEVVSDCSSDGLSTGEMLGKCTIKVVPAVSEMAKGTKDIESDAVERCDGKASDTLIRSGRSRQRGRRYSSSSNSISSSTRPNSLSCDGDLSSSDDTKPGKRRKLRRKKRTTRGGGTNASIVATVDCNTDPSMSTTAGSTHTNVSSQIPTASQHSKASILDAQYVITEAADESATAPPRVLDVINVRNNRVLPSGVTSTRSNRSSNGQSAKIPPAVPGTEGQRRDRKRSAKSKQAAAPVDSDEFINPNNVINWQQEQHQNAAANAYEPAVQSQSGSMEPMDAVEHENQLVKCGNCCKEMLQSCWEEHSNLHNGATFRVGIDYPLDLNDLKAVSAVIGRFMKLKRRAEVACERCGTVKKSGLGMASHLNTCGLSEQELEQAKATCEHCGRKMKAVSLLVHQQQHCRVLKEQQRAIALTTPCEEEITTKETTASGRKKRKSVASAERKIKTMAKEINDELCSELVQEIYGRGVSNAIMQCWLSHLQQSSEAVCGYVGCPFYGMTSEHMRNEYKDDGVDPKPLYQCSKCAYMATSQKPIHEHILIVHPQTLQKIAERQSETFSFAGDSDSDALFASGGGSASTDDMYSSSAPEEDDEGRLGKSKKGKGKKQTAGTPNKSKSKKNGESGKGNSKKGAGKQSVSTECLDTSMTAGGGTEETEVYKEMVLQESIEYKQGKGNYHLLTVNWTQEFRRVHYAVQLLFSKLRPDMDTSYLRSVSNAKDYLPKVAQSMRYVQCNAKQYDPGYAPESLAYRWQQKNTFDGEALGCESMFYCGGPVVSLDWLPLPDDCKKDCDQFLAVTCKQNYDEYYHGEDLAVNRSRKSLVQIWNVGPLENLGSTKITLRSPRLAFAIACDYGPIWQIAFCPSGCYNDPANGDDFERLGLLAVAGSDGDVHLYALSRSMIGTETEEPGTMPRVLHLRPSLLLSLSLTVGSQTHPADDFTGRSVVRISWTREKGHNVLAAGYSNGVVAVWNLAATSPLLSGTKNGIRTLLPVHKLLHSSSGCITALDLHYSSGSRYLVVCNADRRMKVYDLRCNLYQPQESMSMIMRSRISSIRWLLHYPVLVIAYDDALYIDRCAYSVHQPRDIGLRMFSIFTVGSDTTDLGTNDWYSVNAVATSGGDLICHRPVPFVYGMNYKKLAQILTTTIPVKLNAIDDSADVSRYKPFSEEFGLIFSDTDKIPTAMDTAALHLKTWHRSKFNHYPAVRLNQIRWNPNSFSYTYYAIGYQAGFVRVRVMRT